MVTREQLKQGGQRAYERGRLRSAARALWVLVPVVLVCALETRAGETCACLGFLLVGATMFLRWRDRRGTHAATAGIEAGLLPLVVGLVVRRLNPSCADAPLWSLCTGLCLGFGLPSGLLLGLRAGRGNWGAASTGMALSIAVLVASLGCVGLGLSAVAGASVGLVLGGLVGHRRLPAA
jgi:hypothetical protein